MNVLNLIAFVCLDQLLDHRLIQMRCVNPQIPKRHDCTSRTWLLFGGAALSPWHFAGYSIKSCFTYRPASFSPNCSPFPGPLISLVLHI